MKARLGVIALYLALVGAVLTIVLLVPRTSLAPALRRRPRAT